MKNFKFRFPVFVKPLKGSGYNVQPLFNPQVSVHGKGFESAMRALRNGMRRFFQENEADLSELGWFFFNPDYTFLHMTVNLASGLHEQSGKIAVAYCDLGENRFVCLPNLDNKMFVAEPMQGSSGGKRRYDLVPQLEDLLLRHQRQKKKAGKAFDISEVFSQAREFVAPFEMSADVRVAPFRYGGDDAPTFFDSLYPMEDFNGAVELRKVAKELNDFYPDELQRHLFADKQVERIHAAMWTGRPGALAVVGDDGVGKTSMVHESLWRFMARNSDDPARMEKIWHLDPVRVIAGMSVVGMWQRRMESIVEHLLERARRNRRRVDSLFVDNLLAFMNIGRSAQNDLTLADLIKPYLEDRRVTLVVEATADQWKKAQELNRGFTDLFQVIRIAEPEFATVLRIANYQRQQAEFTHGCRFTGEAFVRLVKRYGVQGHAMARPGAITRALQRLAVKYKNTVVDLRMVEGDYQAVSHLRGKILDSGQTLDRQQVHRHFQQLIVGQAQAVRSLTDAVVLLKSAVFEPGKPVRSFLFIGPTGVGKTQAAKCLSHFLYDNSDALVRFDMNEFVDGSAVGRLIGTSMQEGQLTSRIRHRPYSVLLLDEIEKADAAVHDLLLQLLGEGRLSDAMGRTTDFSRCIIIMTSNLGALDAASNLGFVPRLDESGSTYKKAVEKYFRPEFVNRIDEIVIFKPLGREEILKVAKLELRSLLQREGFLRRTTILNVADEVLQAVAERGYDAAMGGRALKRRLESELIATSARQLVTIRPDGPVFFRLLLENGRLRSEISELRFADGDDGVFLPHFPKLKLKRAYYSKLLRRIDSNMQQLNDYRDRSEGAAAPDMLDLLELWMQYKDLISEYVWQLEALHDAPRVAVGAKTLHINSGIDGAVELRGVSLDMDTDERRGEIYDYLQKSYDQARVLVDSKTMSYLVHYGRLLMLEYISQARVSESVDTVTIRISSAVKDPACHNTVTSIHGMMETFLRRYLADIETNIVDELTQEAELSCRGPGLFRLLENEAGIHLFHVPHASMVPVEVTLENQNGESRATGRIVRVYSPESSPAETTSESPKESPKESPSVLDVRYHWLYRQSSSEYIYPWILLNHIREDFELKPVWVNTE